MKELQLGTGFALFLLVSDLQDYKEEKKEKEEEDDDDEIQEADIFKESLDKEALEYYDKYTAHVEIVNSDGDLERVQFRFPTFCKYLSEDSKQKLLWNVDRDTPGQAVQEFMMQVSHLHVEVQWQEIAGRSRLWRFRNGRLHISSHQNGPGWLS